jgi:hypothetical protein
MPNNYSSIYKNSQLVANPVVEMHNNVLKLAIETLNSVLKEHLYGVLCL